MLGIMRIRSLATLVTTTACLGLLALPAAAKPDKEKDKGKAHKVEKSDRSDNGHKGSKAARFSDDDRNAITAIFRGKDGSHQLPPGLAKNLKRGKPLPPGWQKKLSPGTILEQDILGSMTPLPYDLLPSLKRLPDTRLYYHDNRVVRIANATREILDVISLP